MPKSYAENLAERERLVEFGLQSDDHGEALWQMCAEDILFYVNFACWTYAPKLYPDCPRQPWITWPFQDRTILEIQDAIASQHDLGIEKSREMGLTWMISVVPDWFWRFHGLCDFRYGSIREDMVDLPGDPGCLFWKLDFIEKTLPPFLQLGADRTRSHLRIVNERTGSAMIGCATTDDMARGTRPTAILPDEFATVANGMAVLASTQFATNCRIFTSTPKGMGNGFAHVMHNTTIKKLRLHWSEHPVFSQGMYKDKHGKWRSPWYDGECKRLANDTLIAQELDISYVGSDFPFFNMDDLAMVEKRDTRPPTHVGELDFDMLTGEVKGFVLTPGGRWRLWLPAGRPDPRRGHGIGVDVATGTGASNSTIDVTDDTTGEQVAAFASPHILPEQLAHQVAAAARWFGGALVAVEANGMGKTTLNRLVSIGGVRLYFRRDERSIERTPSMSPGWYSTRETKRELLSELRRAMANGYTTTRDALTIGECREYVYAEGAQRVEHARSLNALDPSGAGDNHGDRVVARALSWLTVKHSVEQARRGMLDTSNPPYRSMAWELQEKERAEQEVDTW